MLSGGERDLDLARSAVGEIVEVDDGAVAAGVDEPLYETPVQRAHDLGVRLGQLAEGAPGEGHREAGVVDDGLRVEAERGQLRVERLAAARTAAVGAGGMDGSCLADRKSTRLNSSNACATRMQTSAG